MILTVVLQNVTIGGNWGEATWDLAVVFLTITHESIINVNKISIKNSLYMDGPGGNYAK